MHIPPEYEKKTVSSLIIAHADGICQGKMLRCRTEDSIGFETSLQLKLDYSQDDFSQYSINPLVRKGVFRSWEQVSFLIRYQSCLYDYGARG